MTVFHLAIRRFDLSDNPDIQKVDVEIEKNIDYPEIKQKIQNACKLTSMDNKVIKIRNTENVLIPYSFLTEDDISTDLIVDVSKTSHVVSSNNALTKEAYMKSLQSRLQIMETRLEQAELFLPHLEWKRQSYMEETVNQMLNKVSFLSRRFDELAPSEWRTKFCPTVA